MFQRGWRQPFGGDMKQIRRVIKLIIVTVILIVGMALSFYAIFGYRKEDIGYVNSVTGLKSLALMASVSTNAYGYRTNRYCAFDKFVLSIIGEAPSVVQNSNTANPFPGVLPPERVYGYLPSTSYPTAVAVSPLLWDLTPSSRERVPVLFSDLTVGELPRSWLTNQYSLPTMHLK
jgi:hypothetical protein